MTIAVPRKRYLGFVALGLLAMALVTSVLMAILHPQRLGQYLGFIPKPVAWGPRDRLPMLPVETNAGRRLRHPTLGFSLLDPSPDLTPSVELAERLQKNTPEPATHFYAFSGDDTGTTFLVGIFHGAGDTADALQKLVTNMEAGLHQSTLAQLPSGTLSRRLRDEFVWTDDRREVRRHTAYGEHLHARISAHAIQSKDRLPCVVMLILFSMGLDDYTDLLNSFRAD